MLERAGDGAAYRIGHAYDAVGQETAGAKIGGAENAGVAPHVPDPRDTGPSGARAGHEKSSRVVEVCDTHALAPEKTRDAARVRCHRGRRDARPREEPGAQESTSEGFERRRRRLDDDFDPPLAVQTRTDALAREDREWRETAAIQPAK